jgi:hypothetical protein
MASATHFQPFLLAAGLVLTMFVSIQAPARADAAPALDFADPAADVTADVTPYPDLISSQGPIFGAMAPSSPGFTAAWGASAALPTSYRRPGPHSYPWAPQRFSTPGQNQRARGLPYRAAGISSYRQARGSRLAGLGLAGPIRAPGQPYRRAGIPAPGQNGAYYSPVW